MQSGDVLRVGRGRYVLPESADPWVTALRLGGVASHVTAATVWGLQVINRPSRPHVLVARHRHALPTVTAHIHWADLEPADLDERRPVTSPRRTVLDCARSLPFAEALAIADSALRLGLVGQLELQQAAERLRGAGRGRIRRVARHADARAGSGLESALRAILILGRIGGFEPQLVVQDEDFFARVDLGDRRRMIVAEAESFEYHGHRAALVRDCRRYTELAVRGWQVLRFAWEQVMFEPEWVERMVRAAIAGDGRPSGGQRSGWDAPGRT